MATKQKKQEKTFEEQAKEYAACAIGNIREMVEALEHAAECTGDMDCPACEGTGYTIDAEGDHVDCKACEGNGTVPCSEGKDSDCPEAWHDEEQARERIQEDALSVEVRSDWHTPGDRDEEYSEYCILITTGGPAARIVGNLNRGQASDATFEYQDWGEPWTEVYTASADSAVLLKYAEQFYFGE